MTTLRQSVLSTLVGLPLVMAATHAGAVTVSGSSGGAFSGISGCGGDNCKINSTGEGSNTQLEWGYETFWGFETEGGSTLTAFDRSFSASTPVNDAIIGELSWFNKATDGNVTPNSFNAVYTLSIDFSSPNTPAGNEVFNLNITNPTNPPGDSLSGLAVGDLTSLTGVLNGLLSSYNLLASDVRYAVSGGGSNFLNNIWYNPENNTSTLYITADFNTRPTSVPEPATLGLMSLGLLGMGFAARRRKA